MVTYVNTPLNTRAARRAKKDEKEGIWLFSESHSARLCCTDEDPRVLWGFGDRVVDASRPMNSHLDSRRK